MTDLRSVYQIYVKATPERVWEAITSPDMTKDYYFDSLVESDWRPGSDYAYKNADRTFDLIVGKVLEADPPRRLVQTFSGRWEEGMLADPPTRVTWEIEQMGEACKLTLVHDQFESETMTYEQVNGGWSVILSSLKTLVETGKPMVVGEPAAEVAAS
ncbi:MAG: hypothetical protein QOE92_1480 [Chloroflexota bacterium]|nr:hypothetical protein [Chloroflexota bacterium]